MKKNKLNTVILGACGAVSNLLIDVLIELEATVIGVDVRDAIYSNSSLTEYYKIRITNTLQGEDKFILNKLANADCVILCLPEGVAIEILPIIIPNLKPGCLLVDTLSVKKEYFDRLLSLQNAKEEINILSINPLFKPALGFQNNKIAIIKNTCGEVGKSLVNGFERKKASIIYCSISEHDELMSIVQTLPHMLLLVFGLTLSNSKYSYKIIESFMTPPFKVILSLLSRITTSEPHIYFDIQAKNSFSKNVREDLSAQLGYFSDLISSGDRSRFDHLFEALNTFLGDDAVLLAKHSDDVLKH